MSFQDTISNAFNKAKSGTIAVSLEAKKKMKESSIKGEISTLDSKLSNVYTNIGREAYSNHFEALSQIDGMGELIQNAKDLEGQIEGKQKANDAVIYHEHHPHRTNIQRTHC